MQIRSFYPFKKKKQCPSAEQQKVTFKVYIKVIHLNNKNPFKILPKLWRCPFLRLDGGMGGGGGGGMRVDNSVVGERAGGAGGGASRPTPVNKWASEEKEHLK